jgi:hypothetical protein
MAAVPVEFTTKYAIQVSETRWGMVFPVRSGGVPTPPPDISLGGGVNPPMEKLLAGGGGTSPLTNVELFTLFYCGSDLACVAFPK